MCTDIAASCRYGNELMELFFGYAIECFTDLTAYICGGGLDYFRRKVKRQTAFGMCPYFCGNTVSTDAMRNEKPGENRKEGRRQFIKQ